MTANNKNLDKEFEAGIEAGLKEAIAVFEEGKKKRREISIQFIAAPKYTPNRIRKLRAKFKLSRELFGLLINVSHETVKKWEEGYNKPAGATARLLQLLEVNPGAVMSTIEKKLVG